MNINTDNKVVDINLVQPNTYNPKLNFRENEDNAKEFEKIKESIKIAGQIQAILVREIEGDKFEIINGYHRWEAMKELGFTEIEVKNLGKIDFDTAVSRALLTEDTKVPIDSIELASLIKELVTKEKPIEYWSELLPYDAEIIQNKIEMLDFDWDSFKNKEGDDEGLEGDNKKLVFILDPEQYDIVMQALEKSQRTTNEHSLVIICNQYLDGK